MKYIMFKMDMEHMEKFLPIIFPNDLVHEDVSLRMIPLIAQSFNLDEQKIEPVRAGFINSVDCDVAVHGKSDTLNLSSNEADNSIIKMYDYFHGL